MIAGTPAREDASTMPLTPESLARHELIGLRVRVVAAPNPDLVGIEGRVVGETTRTLTIADAPADASARPTVADVGPRTRRVPKRDTTFEFALPAGTAGEGVDGSATTATYVTVEGERLLARPARRTETAGESPWR